MSEPIQPIETNTDSNIADPDQERLKNVLDALIEYKNELLMRQSTSDQSPETVVAIRTILRNKAKEIRGFLLYKKKYSDNDEKLNECLKSLQAANTPWNSDVSILTNYWCDMIFVKYPFTMKYEHMKNLSKQN